MNIQSLWNLPLDVAKACDEVVENKKLIMRRLLAIGNIMNESAAGKSKTAGIAPDSLILDCEAMTNELDLVDFWVRHTSSL